MQRACTKCAICSHCAHTAIFKDHAFEGCSYGYAHKGKCSRHGQKPEQTAKQKESCCVLS